MRILLSGATGLLGRYLIASAPADAEIVALSRDSSRLAAAGIARAVDIDLRDSEKLAVLLADISPDVIIHAAAEGSVDAVQGNSDDFQDINVNVAADLACWCREVGARLTFVSSNAVFGGSTTAYSDYSPLQPVNDYGRLKALAENMVRSILPSAFVPRPILLYGWPLHGSRSNPVVDWVRSLRLRSELRIVNDVTTQPLAASDAAMAIWRGIGAQTAGPVNLSGGTSLTLYEFALTVAEAFKLDATLIDQISSQALTGLAPRPMQTSFDLKRMRNELGLEPMSPAIGLLAMREQEI